jgi:monoterpene epsilon-lactone hydrolase
MRSEQAERLFGEFAAVAAATADRPFDLETERANAEAAGTLPTEAAGVAVEEVTIAGRRGLRLEPAGALDDRHLVFVHGGAYVLMSPDSHARFVGHLAAVCGAVTSLPSYRRAPEDPFPAAVDDVDAAIDELLGTHPPERTVVAGDSAGAGLVVAALLRRRDRGAPMPVLAVLLAPWLDLTCSGESIEANADRDVVLSRDNLPICADLYLDGADPTHPWASPLFADLHGLPPCYLQVGDEDLLRDDSLRFVRAARAAGVDARVDVYPEMPHDFQFFAGRLPEADGAIRSIDAVIRGVLGPGRAPAVGT